MHAEGTTRATKEEGREKRGSQGSRGKRSFHPAVSAQAPAAPAQRLWVLTEWSEAPSRACIAAALTAGIAAAPLTHAGSGDTAAPC